MPAIADIAGPLKQESFALPEPRSTVAWRIIQLTTPLVLAGNDVRGVDQ
jgi:hypothetical protein